MNEFEIQQTNFVVAFSCARLESFTYTIANCMDTIANDDSSWYI